ncbi:MAG: cytochrome d ubiquinol oxidase subunit II [Thermoleophilia bacterium]|nr:cytochrome d ubiquinol oxidase subunit II [Thermoleophilia bacterium]
MADAVLVLLLVGLTAYAVLGGADFGAGLWDLTAGGARRGAGVRDAIARGMGPVWEANHVWLIFVLVILWTGFSVAFGSIMSTLAVALFAAAVGIILRGAAFAFRGEAGTVAQQRLLGGTFALSSLIVPFFLGAVVGGVASGRVPVGNATGDLVTSWANPTSLMIGLIAIATGAHLAAVYLAADTHRRGERDLADAFRWRGALSGVVAGSVALIGLVVVRSDARPLFDGLTGDGLPLVILSGVAGIATIALVWARRPAWARLTAALAVGSVIGAWALAQAPEFLPGALTVDQAASDDATLAAVLIAAGVGLCVLIPSLVLLYRLALGGRLDPSYRPLGADRADDDLEPVA